MEKIRAKEWFLNYLEGATVHHTYHGEFIKKNGKIIMEQDAKRKVLYVHKYNIWLVFENKGISVNDIVELISSSIKEKFNWKISTPICASDYQTDSWKRIEKFAK